MKICPITYQMIDNDERYSIQGLKRLAPTLSSLQDLAYSAEEQRLEALKQAQKLSIQGMQLKLSAKLNIQQACFEITDKLGKFILKPQSELYPELPENEDLSMRLAASIDIEVPFHCLLYSKEGSLTYCIKRFDRYGHREKLAVEDFAQLAGETRETKYNSSIERIIPLIENFCTFPVIEKIKFFNRMLFNYLIGNEDMHLKNFSLIRRDDKVELAPAYDFLNTSIVLYHPKEELALSLRGKKSNLQKKDFLNYLAQEKLKLNTKIIEKILEKIQQQVPVWRQLIRISFLSDSMKQRYLDLLDKRINILS
jgi:serine/threonine-protein kinase HipA